MQISLGLPPWHDSSKIVSGKPGAVHYLRHFAGDQDDLNSVLANEPFPVMHSPISGTTIAQLFATAGSGAAFFALFPHPDLGQIATYFLVVGGTKIVFGA
ncbi:hypothetical protein QFZ94_006763, partial [Paraburkholderia sp. JPY465]|uniref:hypothetical protein n=1 Tax=Paraburkholderia sp. JPY465 TaxID=3042285 RepID=UPI003D2242C3